MKRESDILNFLYLFLIFKIIKQIFHILMRTLDNRQNRLRFVFTHFKSCDQSLDKNFLISLTYFVSRKAVP